MGLSQSSTRVEGIDIYGRDLRLEDILNKNKDFQHMLNYTRKFLDRHMEIRDKETDYQTEIFYAKKVLALVKPYAPENLKPPEFIEKPPTFDGKQSTISDYEFQTFITDCMGYFSATLSSIKISN